jgi:hypothetical protein
VSLIDRLVDRHVRKPARDAVRRAMTRWCPECQKDMPFGHTCVIKTDFKRRKRQAERPARRRSQAKGTSAARPHHDYRTCADQDCQRTACVAYREGMANCPLTHR